MNPVPDPLYRIHRHQAAQRGVPPLSPDQFCLRLRDQSDTDLTQLLAPRPLLTLQLRLNLHDQFWGEKTGGGPVGDVPPARRGVPRRSVCAID